MKFLYNFFHDDRDYYGDLKLTLAYLVFCACQVALVLGVQHWF